VTADEALGLSILHRVAATASDADKIVEAWTRPLLRRSEAALRATKDLFDAYARSAVQGDVATLDTTILSSILASRALSPSRPAAPETIDRARPNPDPAQPEGPRSRETAWMAS
jgi:enoyl-CoA hydratase/carnithine racemase